MIQALNGNKCNVYFVSGKIKELKKKYLSFSQYPRFKNIPSESSHDAIFIAFSIFLLLSSFWPDNSTLVQVFNKIGFIHGFLSATPLILDSEHNTLTIGGWRWAIPPTPEFGVGDTNMLLVSWKLLSSEIIIEIKQFNPGCRYILFLLRDTFTIENIDF